MIFRLILRPCCHRSVVQFSRRTFFEKLQSRGLVKELFPEGKYNQALELITKQKPQTFYAGFDTTADSLHLGNLVTLITLIHVLREGHKVICIIGDATAMVGDPSGKSRERPQLSEEEIDRNSYAISSDINKIFSNHFKYFWKNTFKDKSIHEPIILNNKSWYSNINVIDYAYTIGRNLRVGEMLSRSSVKDRMESNEGLSLAEFMYQSFQSNDWLYLRDRYGCNFQIGGIDQMGNIETGYLMIKKMRGTAGSLQTGPRTVDAYGLMTPILTNERGEKIGKSSIDGSAIWLNRSKLSPFDFYQHFIRLPDSEVGQYLKLFTFLTTAELDQIMDKFLRKTASRSAHEKLAEQLTLLVHGKEGLDLALKGSKALYNKDITGMNAIRSMTFDEMKEIFGSNLITRLYFDPTELEEESKMTILDLSMRVKCFETISDAGRIIRAGGFHVNQQQITDPETVVNESDHILPNDCTLIRVGKKRFHLIKWR